MDYEEIADMQRFRMPPAGTYVDRQYEPVRADEDTNTARNGPSSLAVSYAGGLSPMSPSTTVHHVDPALYTKVIRRCLLALVLEQSLVIQPNTVL